MIFISLIYALLVYSTPVDDFKHAARQQVNITQTGRGFVSSVVRKARKPWEGHFAAENFNKPTERTALQNIKKNLQTAVLALPREHTEVLQSLEVKNSLHVSRGLANSKKIILNTGNIDTDQELKAVFIHELGHIVDLGKFKGQHGHHSGFKDGKKHILTDDPSLQFYRLSWTNAETRRADSSQYDFVSRYAMTDIFEDFAESYLFYRLHGAKFRAATTKSEILGKKYAFLRDQVFAGQQFQTDQYVQDYIPGLIWDATLLGYEGLN